MSDASAQSGVRSALGRGITQPHYLECSTVATGPSLADFLTNMDQPMPWRQKMGKLLRNLWRRVALRQNCCGNPGEPGC